MTVIEAYEDAVATVRVWQGAGLSASVAAGLLRRRGGWQEVIETIVLILLAAP